LRRQTAVLSGLGVLAFHVRPRGTLVIARQRIHVGMIHAGRTLTVEDADHTFRIYDDAEVLAEVARTTTRPIARFKVRKPEPSRQNAVLRPEQTTTPLP